MLMLSFIFKVSSFLHVDVALKRCSSYVQESMWLQGALQNYQQEAPDDSPSYGISQGQRCLDRDPNITYTVCHTGGCIDFKA